MVLLGNACSALQGAECQTCDLSGNSLSDPWQTLRTALTDWPELCQVGTEATLKKRGVGDRMERKSRIQKLEEEPPPPPRPQWLSKTSAVGGVSVHWHGQRPSSHRHKRHCSWLPASCTGSCCPSRRDDALAEGQGHRLRKWRPAGRTGLILRVLLARQALGRRQGTWTWGAATTQWERSLDPFCKQAKALLPCRGLTSSLRPGRKCLRHRPTTKPCD